MLGSGIPRGTRVLFSMEPGVDGRLFMISTLNNALSRGHRCLVVIPTSTTRVFRNEIQTLKNVDIDDYKDRIVVLDSSVREYIHKKYHVRAEEAKEWKSLISETCEKNLIDIIFVYYDLIYEDLGLKAGLGVLDITVGDRKPTVVLEHLNLEGDKLLSRFSSDFSFDLIISLKSGFTPVPYFNFFTLEYTSWSNMPRRSIPYIITNNSISLYIPKIIVTGPPASGKTTFVNQASDRGISGDRKDLRGTATTVAMDLGWLHFKGFDITIYGTPGQPRFDPILPQLASHAMGVVMVIDVTRPEQMDRVRTLMELAKVNLIPMVIAANKCDLPHTLSEAGIRDSLHLKEDVPVHFISALRRSDVRRVVEALVHCITTYPF